MALFTKKEVSLDQASIGSYIKKIREKRGVNLEDVSRDIKINVEYLEAIEKSDYKKLPKGIYSKIFFKKYIKYLGVRHKNILNDFVREQSRSENFQNNIFFSRIVDWKNLLSFPIIIRNLIVFLLVLACFFYLLFYFKNIFAPPSLKLIEPSENKIVNESSIEIRGWAEDGSELKINDRGVLLDEEGYFQENINLKSGLNIIELRSKKRYSQERVIIREILVEQ
jgi:cytoskeletal protein RodZ